MSNELTREQIEECRRMYVEDYGCDLDSIVVQLCDIAIKALSAPSATGAMVLVPRERLEELLVEIQHQFSVREDYQERDHAIELVEAMLSAAPVDSKGTAAPVEERRIEPLPFNGKSSDDRVLRVMRIAGMPNSQSLFLALKQMENEIRAELDALRMKRERSDG